MTMPGFSAEASFFESVRTYRAGIVPTGVQNVSGVYPALAAGGMRLGCALCISICSIFDGEFECGLRCTAIGLCRPVILEG
jgi:hypothetical protein